MCDLVVARTSAAIRGRGTIRRGAVLCADDPVVLQHASVFQPLRMQHFCGDVEQMTARPGERRDVKLPAGRPPKSGPGSGIEAWRAHAAEVTGESPEALAELSRDELIELVGA